MKKIYLILFVFIGISISSFSQINANNKDSIDKKITGKDSVNKKPATERDMFGLHLTRGVKINGEGLADGYIMFAVPNSSYVYLINRRGDVVHEWKGNYAVFHAYLQND